jgi:hypothetical protein
MTGCAVVASSAVAGRALLGHDQVRQARERIAPLVEAIIERARASGQLRPEFAATDAIFIQLALGALMDRTRDIAPALYRRYLTMFLDGVRADGPCSELPVAPLSVEQTHRDDVAVGGAVTRSSVPRLIPNATGAEARRGRDRSQISRRRSSRSSSRVSECRTSSGISPASRRRTSSRRWVSSRSRTVRW